MIRSLSESMDHQGAGVGSENEAFYDLLKASKANSNLNSSYGSGGENPSPIPEYEYGNESALPSLDFHNQQMQSTGALQQPSQKNFKAMYASSSSTSSLVRAEDSLSAGIKAYQASAPPSSSHPQVYGTQEPPPNKHEYPSQWQDQGSELVNSAILEVVDRIVKSYVDGIFRLLQNLIDVTSKLECRTQELELSIQVLKNSVADSHGDAHGKLQVLENLIREVQAGVEVLSEKQDIAGTESQLAKLQLKNDPSGNISSSSFGREAPSSIVTQGSQSELSMKQQLSSSPQQHTPPSAAVQQHLPSPPSNIPYQQPLLPPFPQPSFHPGLQHQRPFPQPSIPPGLQQQQSIPSAAQSSQLPPEQQPVPPQYQPQPTNMQTQILHVRQGLPLQQQYNQQPDVGRLPQVQHFQGPQQPPHSSAKFPADIPPYMPSKFELLPERPPLSPFQTPPQPPHGHSGAQRYPGQLPATAHYLPNSQPFPAAPYESHSSMASGGYGVPNYRIMQPSLPTGGGYPHLPTAQPLNTISNPASANGMSSADIRSIDEVIENVASMGFSREQARAVIQRLNESGQPVDLNNVLDRLMNGGESQPQKAWIGR